jgi:hypothetical protein
MTVSNKFALLISTGTTITTLKSAKLYIHALPKQNLTPMHAVLVHHAPRIVFPTNVKKIYWPKIWWALQRLRLMLLLLAAWNLLPPYRAFQFILMKGRDFCLQYYTLRCDFQRCKHPHEANTYQPYFFNPIHLREHTKLTTNLKFSITIDGINFQLKLLV